MKILVIGSGAVGSFYGSLLAKAGAEVAMVARSDYPQVREHGITIRSESPLGTYRFRPVQVFRDVSEVDFAPDYVLLCIKVVEGADRAGLLRGALAPSSHIVLISNGVEIEAEIAAAFPEHELISGLAFICVSRTAPAEVWHQAYGRLSLGTYPRGVSPAVERLCQAFGATGITCHATADIVAARWQKCVWNAPFNPLSVLSGGLDTRNILAHAEPLVRSIMMEVCQLAGALGHPPPADLIDQQIEGTRRMPPYKTSMLLDFEAGRPLETEAILGNAVRAARRIGLATPILDTLYALLKLRDLRRSRSDSAQG